MVEYSPELYDIGRWLDASESRKREILGVLSETLGFDHGRFGTVYGDPAPVDRPPAPAWSAGSVEAMRLEFALPALQGGLRIEHEPSGILFCLIPGGTTEIGFSEGEMAYFESPEFLDSDLGMRSWTAGEVHTLHQLRATWGASSRRVQTETRTFGPFLLAESPLTGTQLAQLGLEVGGKKRLYVGADCVTTLEPDEIELVLPPLMRLPTSDEWEHACRAGTRTPFPWGTDFPAYPIDALHPLGLTALGHFREATGSRFDQGDGHATPETWTVRGGAVQSYPWAPGGADWVTCLCAYRSAWNRTRAGPDRAPSALRQVAVRPLIPLPFPAPDARESKPRVSLPRPAKQTNVWVSELLSMDGEVRKRAIDALTRHLSGPMVWSGQAVAILPHLVALVLEDWLPDRHRIVTLLAELVSRGHEAIPAIGLDRTDPRLEQVLKLTQARALRALLVEHLPRLSHLALDADPRLRAAWVMLLSLVPELEQTTRERIDAMFETAPQPALCAGLLLGLGRLDGWRRRPDVPRYTSFYDDPHPLVRGAARLGHLGADPGALGMDMLETRDLEALLSFVADNVEDPEHFPWFTGDLGLLCARWISEHRSNDGPIIAGVLLSRLIKKPELTHHPRIEAWAKLAIEAGLCGRQQRSLETLTELQWEVISNLARRDFPGATALWREARLPERLAERRSLLLAHGKRF